MGKKKSSKSKKSVTSKAKTRPASFTDLAARSEMSKDDIYGDLIDSSDEWDDSDSDPSSSSEETEKIVNINIAKKVPAAPPTRVQAAAAPAQPAAREKKMTNFVKDEVPEYETILKIHIKDSLENLARKRELLDENGNLKLSLAHGITVQEASPDIMERIESRRNIGSNSDVARNPAKFESDRRDIVQSVECIHAHNKFPVPMVLSLASVQIPPEKRRIGVSKIESGNPLTLVVEEGQTINQKPLFDGCSTMNDVGFFSQYPHFTANNIREGIRDVLPYEEVKEDGTVVEHARVGIPHTEEKPHPMIFFIKSHIDEITTPEEKALDRKLRAEGAIAPGTVNVPSRILDRSDKSKRYVVMDKEIFESMAARCEAGINNSHPLSCMDHPHGVLGRRHEVSHFSAGRKSIHTSSRSRFETDFAHDEESFSNRVTDRSRSNALSTPYSFHAEFRIKSIKTSELGKIKDTQ